MNRDDEELGPLCNTLPRWTKNGAELQQSSAAVGAPAVTSPGAMHLGSDIPGTEY